MKKRFENDRKIQKDLLHQIERVLTIKPSIIEEIIRDNGIDRKVLKLMIASLILSVGYGHVQEICGTPEAPDYLKTQPPLGVNKTNYYCGK